MRIASAAALIAILVTTPASAVEPLQPTAKWNVDFGDAHCTAMRNYGTDDLPLVLALKRAPIGEVTQVSVLRVSGKKDTDQYPGTMAVGGSAPVKVSVLGYPAKAGKTRLISFNLPPSDFLPVRTASVLRLKSAGEVDHSFALSQMEPVARALDLCIADLRKVWNITDAAKDIGPTATPKAPLFSYFESADYPTVAARGEATGTVALVTLIDEAGKVASCMVTQTSGYASLDA